MNKVAKLIDTPSILGDPEVLLMGFEATMQINPINCFKVLELFGYDLWLNLVLFEAK